MISLLSHLSFLLALTAYVSGSPHQLKRADTSLVGYLGAFFLGADPQIFFYRSNGNNPVSFKALNGGSAVIVPTLGTQGVRDPAIVVGGGNDEGKKWYIVGTDLDIAKTTWDRSVRTGSRGIFVWESTDLINWTNERLVTVEDGSAGMVWAPEALWDKDKGQYLVHWASKFYSSSDPAHSGTATNTLIRYAYTKDFRSFTAPQTLIDYTPYDIIDLTFLPLDNSGKSYARFLKNETNGAKYVFEERSTNGLFGPWTRVNGMIASGTEGPAVYWDNSVEGKAHLLLDYYGGNPAGYRPFESTNVAGGTWATSSSSGFPTGLRHGSILPVNSKQYNALIAKWN